MRANKHFTNQHKKRERHRKQRTKRHNRTISTTEPEIDYISGRVQNFEGARATAYAIDVNSGALSLIDPEEALYRFLSKQPDIAIVFYAGECVYHHHVA